MGTTDNSHSSHFKGESVPEHLRSARRKGSRALAELHGIEMSGAAVARCDALRDTSLTLLILWVVLPDPFSIILFTGCALCLWKPLRSGLLGWARLERLHRLIEEERWEIEHNREQEKEELKEMYAAKGFSGAQLESVTDVLMADDNRLLRVMLEEELGLSLETFEHPLTQSMGALTGALLAGALCVLGLWLYPLWGLPVAAALCVGGGAVHAARLENNAITTTLLWHLGSAALVAFFVYFLKALFNG
jgi:hypothetical protein